jgi:pimeloyl-ACP methyl ester carboxylesterase
MTGVTLATCDMATQSAWAEARTVGGANGGAKAQTGASAQGRRAMTAAEFHASRRFVETPFGRIAYVERGSGAVALFLHGLPLNGFQWRGAIARLSDRRRCLAPDFLGLGYTETRPDQSLAPVTQADMIAAVLDALSIEAADVIANDSGGGVAQLLAARHPARVRTLLLTNCDAHTNSPPAAMAPELEAARKGVLADALARNVSDKAFARSAEGIGTACFTNPASLTDEAIDCYFAPLIASPTRRAQFHGYLLAFEPNPLPAIEPALKRCTAPVRMVWGTGDKYFDVSWADWLDRTFPRSRGVRRVEGAKLFFPEEMPDLIAQEARALWDAVPASGRR